jgi:hypothetical protein
MKSLIPILISFTLSLSAEVQFKPYEANIFEGRVGVTGQPSEENLRLDIGMTYDLFDLAEINGNKLTLGTDWMVWTRLQSEGRFKFPVETSDYWFGVNMTYVADDYGIRMRLAHISSHLVDGYTNRTADSWEFLKTPFVYSREFVELSAYYNLTEEIRVYGGVSYLFSTIPDDFVALTPQAGFDFVYPVYNFDNGGQLQIRGGVDLKITDNIDKLRQTVSSQLTVGYFSDSDTGVALGIYGYDGHSMHGMFFMDVDSYLGVGGQIYFY